MARSKIFRRFLRCPGSSRRRGSALVHASQVEYDHARRRELRRVRSRRSDRPTWLFAPWAGRWRPAPPRGTRRPQQAANPGAFRQETLHQMATDETGGPSNQNGGRRGGLGFSMREDCSPLFLLRGAEGNISEVAFSRGAGMFEC